MLKELANFTQSLDPVFKDIGLEPKEGLHIVLSFEEGLDNTLHISDKLPDYCLYRKKKTDKDELLGRCTAWARTAWMVDTNKCLDLPAKKIHSASPYCLAYKLGSVLSDTQLEIYFNKAGKLLPDEESSRYAQTFRQALNSWEKIQKFLSQVLEVNPTDDEDKDVKSRALKDGEYIIFYANIPLDCYQQVSSRYLGDKLFNTSEHNATVGSDIFGTSAFFNGFPTKKPFLSHQTATFDIAGRISATDALRLFEFKDLIGRGIFPRPLPIFVYKEERERALSLFKTEALKEPAQRKSHADIITELYEAARQNQQELGNYYLLYYHFGEIKDFDFVSKFEYELWDAEHQHDWLQIQNLMGVASTNKQLKVYPRLTTVFQLLSSVFTPLIGNKYLRADNFFGDLEEKDYIITSTAPSQHLTMTYLAFRRYRKAVYDFIYKSRHDALDRNSFWDMAVNTISDDLKYARSYQIKEKLNILFSLNHFFDPQNRNFNGLYMPDKLDQLTAKLMQIADSRDRVPVTDEYEFAFLAGQMIDYLLSLSNSSDDSHAALEGFVQKTDVELFKQEIARLFLKYKHDVERPGDQRRNRVANLMREIMGFDRKVDMKRLHVFVLAGYFSPTFFYRKKQSDQSDSTAQPTETNNEQ